MGQYRHHVFVCTDGKHCAKDGADDVHSTLKKGVKDAGLKHEVRVNRAGCMNQCGHGPMVVVYPDDVWYAGVSAAGARRIADEHLAGGCPVSALRYVAPPGDNKK
jgi:(2Fe-2S) ferredoxin